MLRVRNCGSVPRLIVRNFHSDSCGRCGPPNRFLRKQSSWWDRQVFIKKNMVLPGMHIMKNILIVEDSRMFSNLLKREVLERKAMQPVVTESFAQTKALLEAREVDFFAALLDINLPDAPAGEVVDLVISHGIPAIVFTGEFSDELRERMLNKRVVDYVLKESASSISHVVSLIDRLMRNRLIKVLVVDDSRSARMVVVEMLKVHNYVVLEAADGHKAMELLEKHPDVRLVITDYNMPGMDGFELTRQIRQKFDKNQLAIIGLSSYGNNILSARFLKRGANDFISKPFLPEEFFVRVTQNIEIVEYIDALRDAAIKDFLTGLYNRRHFMDAGEKIHARAREGEITLIAGAVDVDFFKKVNDTYGHDAGDAVLKKVGSLLASHGRDTDLVARMGGEEFSVLLVNANVAVATQYFERLRAEIQALAISHNNQELRITASFGVCCSLGDSLAQMLDRADHKLYDAKKNGRNRVEIG